MTVSAIKPTNDVINNNIENRFEYDASIGQIFAIWILNFFLSIITIGIYSFWGKTKMRKYMANSLVFWVIDSSIMEQVVNYSEVSLKPYLLLL